MKRWWVSWWHGGYEDEGWKEPSFKHWITGQRDRVNNGLSPEMLIIYNSTAFVDEGEMWDFLDQHGRDDASYVAVIDAPTEKDVWKIVEEFFPGCQQRFCNEREADYDPTKEGGRFS